MQAMWPGLRLDVPLDHRADSPCARTTWRLVNHVTITFQLWVAQEKSQLNRVQTILVTVPVMKSRWREHL